MNNQVKSILTFVPALIWALIIFKLSTGSSVQISFAWDDLIGIDKIGHALFYLVQTFLLYWAFEKQAVFKTQQQRKWISFLLGVSLGILLELVQLNFYPNRYFEILDIFANIIGSYLGVYFLD